MKRFGVLYSLFSACRLWDGAYADDGKTCTPGEVQCRHKVTTGPDVDENTCTELAVARFAGMKLFFEINPQLDKDCNNIRPNTEYCVMGCVCEPPAPKPTVGQIMCRYYTQPTGSEVNQNTCKKLADDYHEPVETFFKLNPQVDRDCKTIQPNTKYCIKGFLEPLRAWDGLCGPNHNNATCIGTDKQCCNSETWQCGDTSEDCSPGTCYEGICYGVKVYGVDGKCGPNHGGRLCAGKWGDCCNFDGICGTGMEFCDLGQCESGNCGGKWLGFDNVFKPRRTLPWAFGNTTDGTCGGTHNYSCNIKFGNCCSKGGICGSSWEHCGDGCQSKLGHCFV